VHRDLKPSNILLGDRSGNSPGQVYLVDFGSVQTAAHGGTRTVVGTYGYMPPEQFGGQTTPAVDLYALGATLIYLATGQHPDQLPQRELRILFADRASSLSPPFITWLQALTEPSLDLRILSVKQALAQLERQHSSESCLAIASKPKNSKIKLTKSAESLELIVPPTGFNRLQPSNFPTVFYVLGLLITILIPFISLVFIIFALFFVHIRAVSFHRRLCLTQSEISKQSKSMWGENSVSATLTPRADVKLKLRRHTSPPADWQEEERKTGRASSQVTRLHIVVGPKVISLYANGKSGQGDNLTSQELWWITQELSNWLDVPIG
jgi:serine/threonine protein kinase